MLEKHPLCGSVLAERFEIKSVIGTGGMGTVYLASHVLLQRQFAIKVIRSSLASDPSALAQFRREARAASRVIHPNITSVYDFGHTNDGSAFFVMEYVEGTTLARAIDSIGCFPLQRALDVLGQVAQGLAAAHLSGVVHRDLNPHNVMLTTYWGQPDFVKILDFGVAQLFGGEMGPSGQASKAVYGTPAYASPEQCRGAIVGPPSDIYSFGVMAYELLTGALPFGGGVDEMIRGHLQLAPPPLSMLRSEIAPAVESLVMHCLSKHPEERYADGAALAKALEEVRQKLGLQWIKLPTQMAVPAVSDEQTDPVITAPALPETVDIAPRYRVLDGWAPPMAEVGEASSDAADEELRTVSELADLEATHSRAREDLTCALLDRDLASPEIRCVHALKITAEERLLDAEAQIALLEDEGAELQRRGRQSETRLLQALAEMQQARIQWTVNEPSPALPGGPDVAAELHEQELKIMNTLVAITLELEQQLAALRERLDEQRQRQQQRREELASYEAQLAELLRELCVQQPQAFDPQLRLLCELAAL